MSQGHLTSMTKPMMQVMRLILKVRVSHLMSFVRIIIFRCFHLIGQKLLRKVGEMPRGKIGIKRFSFFMKARKYFVRWRSAVIFTPSLYAFACSVCQPILTISAVASVFPRSLERSYPLRTSSRNRVSSFSFLIELPKSLPTSRAVS